MRTRSPRSPPLPSPGSPARRHTHTQLGGVDYSSQPSMTTVYVLGGQRPEVIDTGLIGYVPFPFNGDTTRPQRPGLAATLEDLRRAAQTLGIDLPGTSAQEAAPPTKPKKEKKPKPAKKPEQKLVEKGEFKRCVELD